MPRTTGIRAYETTKDELEILQAKLRLEGKKMSSAELVQMLLDEYKAQRRAKAQNGTQN